MPSELIALPPVAFALWLLLGAGVLGERPDHERAAVALTGAALLGPAALALLGLFGWLTALALGTVALTGFAAQRRSGRRLRQPSGSLLRAVLNR